jgi:hypothetical protein
VRNAPDKIEVIGDPTVTYVEGIPEYGWPASYEVQGWYSVLDTEEAPLWEGQQVEASVRLPTAGNPIAPGNRVKVNGKRFVVVTTREQRMRGPGHIRAMLRRSE